MVWTDAVPFLYSYEYWNFFLFSAVWLLCVHRQGISGLTGKVEGRYRYLAIDASASIGWVALSRLWKQSQQKWAMTFWVLFFAGYRVSFKGGNEGMSLCSLEGYWSVRMCWSTGLLVEEKPSKQSARPSVPRPLQGPVLCFQNLIVFILHCCGRKHRGLCIQWGASSLSVCIYRRADPIRRAVREGHVSAYQ